jgi:putative Holliday junction resolvase
MSRILAIDYGAKRVGLAVTDTLQISANGLPTLPEPEVLSFLKKYLHENNVQTILIGYATHPDGSDTNVTPLVRKFIEKLEKEFPGIPVIKRDETYSSKFAVKAMIAAGVRKTQRRKKENIDKMSAVLILQEYLTNIQQ